MFEKILVLSQKAEHAETIKSALADFYFVIVTPDVHSALQYLKKNSDLRAMLIDIDTPKLVVEQFLEILSVHASYRNLKTIVLAERNQQIRIARCLEKGATDYLTFPLEASSLKMIVDLHVSNSDTLSDNQPSPMATIFQRLFFGAPIGVAITRITSISDTEQLTSVIMNPAYETIIGRTKSELQNYDWKAVTHPDDLEESAALFEKLRRGDISSYERTKRYIRPNGEVVWVNLVVNTFDQENENVFSYISLIQDVTEQKRTNELLLESERSKAVLLSHLPGLAYRCKYDNDWTMQFVSPGCKQLTGYDAFDLIQNRALSYNDLIAKEYRAPIWLEWKRVTAEHLSFSYEYEIVTKNGPRKWVLELGEAVYNTNGEVEALEGIVIDIDYLKKMEATIKHKNDYDSLTNLHNRQYFENLLEQDLKTGRLYDKSIIGINFSQIHSLVLANGYHYGMDLILRIANILKLLQNGNCELFITHENRFCFYIKTNKREELIEFYQRIAKDFEPILLLERISCGVGILETTHTKYSDADQILKDALIATERALSLDSDKIMNYVFFDKQMQHQIDRQQTLIEELHALSESLDDDGLIVDFQPVIDLKTEKVTGFEALSRFKSPTFGIISPLEFIPLLERSKLIVPIGEKIVSRALKFLRTLNSRGHDLSISVNVSAIQLLSHEFAIRMIQKIRDVGVNPSKIWFEITESIFTSNYNRINQILGDIMKTGVKVTIDDFGTGYSSLHRVLELNTNGIKIDRAFIDGIEKISEDIAITKDIVSLGHKLHYVVVAEGIENETQKKYLQSYQCDHAQGYLFSQPLSEKQALEFLDKINIQ